MNSVWTDENTERAVLLNREGWSATEIGNELGVSRNAVIGRLHRVTKEIFTGSSGLQRPNTRPKRPMIFRKKRLPRPQPQPQQPSNKSLLDLESKSCHWPIDNFQPYHFCGAPALEGSCYCNHHHRMSVR
jgi:GcrA cell cycle regulator